MCLTSAKSDVCNVGDSGSLGPVWSGCKNSEDADFERTWHAKDKLQLVGKKTIMFFDLFFLFQSVHSDSIKVSFSSAWY